MRPSLQLLKTTRAIQTDESHISITLQVNIASRPIKFLVDTGASRSFIKKKLLLPGTIIKDMCGTFFGISGDIQTTLGQVFVHLIFNGYKIYMNFDVVDDSVNLGIGHDGILGLNILRRYSAYIDLENLTLTLTIPLPQHDTNPIELSKRNVNRKLKKHMRNLDLGECLNNF